MKVRNRPSLRRPYLIALAMTLTLVAVVYYAFHPSLPFVTGYRLDAVVQSSNGLRGGSPVRIAGVDVGKVVEIDKGPGATSVVTMQLEDRGRPVHADATLRIVPRVFLEGGFAVELEPGSPSAPELPDDGTIGITQTAIPVQFHQALSAFEAPTRESLRRTFSVLAEALDDGGAEGLRDLAPELEPLLRDLAWVGRASRGTEAHDVSSLISAVDRITTALDDDPERLGALVDSLEAAARAVEAEDDNLARTIEELSATLRASRPALRTLDGALPSVERASRQVAPALPGAPRAFRDTDTVLRRLGALVAPARRARTIGAMELALRDLPGLVGTLAATLPPALPVTSCLSSHIVPMFESEVPDGALSSGRPVWQDFAHAIVGLASAAQNFDGDGHNMRYGFGIGSQSVSTADLPGIGPLLGTAPGPLQSRPLPRRDRKQPPINADAPCSEQPKVDLRTPSGPSGLRTVRAQKDEGKPLSRADLRRLLQPSKLRRLLKERP